MSRAVSDGLDRLGLGPQIPCPAESDRPVSEQPKHLYCQQRNVERPTESHHPNPTWQLYYTLPFRMISLSLI